MELILLINSTAICDWNFLDSLQTFILHFQRKINSNNIFSYENPLFHFTVFSEFPFSFHIMTKCDFKKWLHINTV